jgi:hypothetical protein
MERVIGVRLGLPSSAPSEGRLIGMFAKHGMFVGISLAWS